MRIGLAATACCVFVLAGCSGGAFHRLDQAAVTGGVAGASLAGMVHGGQQPIAGAHVYLFAAGTAGYGGAGIAASSSNASLSLLQSGAGTTLDSSGGATNGDYYVTTDSSGGFSISGDYTCAQNSQVYLYALGGNPGSGANAAAGLMAVLGSCPAAGNFATAIPFVMVNEVSTIAAAYAMAGFATDATHVSSSGTTAVQTGIANAFANAGNLVTLSTGVALATTPAGNGAVPRGELNTLGNVLAACVNSTGAASSACSTLLTNALGGGTTGAQPADTATAAINMAHNPAANIANLYALASATPPFGPVLGAQPNDWTVMIAFTVGGLSGPYTVAVDGSGNAWIASVSGNSVCEVSSLGAVLSGASGYSGGGMSSPRYIAIDLSGNPWVTGGSNNVVEFSGAGVVLSGPSGYLGRDEYGGNSLINPFGIAIDGSGNVWVPNIGGYRGVTELASTGSVIGWVDGVAAGMPQSGGVAVDASGAAWIPRGTNDITVFTTPAGSAPQFWFQPGGGLNGSTRVAIDAAGSAWLMNFNSSVSKISSGFTALSGASGFTGGGMGGLHDIAVDGGGNAWVASLSSKSVVELSNSGAVLSGPVGYQSGTANGYGFLAIDGSGDVWLASSAVTLTEIVGAAVPVVTPLSVGVKNNMLGTRP